MNAIYKAIHSVKGGQAKLARELGVSAQFVSQWVHGSRPIPARHVLKIESITGIPRLELRPDIFNPPETKREAA